MVLHLGAMMLFGMSFFFFSLFFFLLEIPWFFVIFLT